tara:strand:+ start:1881 stop:2408 length:528 start_codon:yes stop_codon:yes gene_type:complete
MKMKNNFNSYPKYSLLAKYLHWSFVVLFAYGIYKQVEDLSDLEDLSLLKFEIFFAFIFLLFLAFRFVYMTKTQRSSLPENTPKAQKLAAKLVHFSMYFCLFGIVSSGLMIGFLYWFGIKVGYLIEFSIFIHESFFSIIYWLISIHVIASIYHRFKQDGVWNSMVPFLKENKTLIK